MVNIEFDWIPYTQNIDNFRRNFKFSENKKQIRYIIMNLLSFSVTSIFHVIIVEKQLLKHAILTHCLTCNFRHMSQYNSFPSVWRGLTEHRREHPVYLTPTFVLPKGLVVPSALWFCALGKNKQCRLLVCSC